MNTIKALILLPMVLLMVAGVCAQDNQIEKDKLTVFGKVRVFAKADRAIVTFEIEGLGKSLRAAFDDAETKMDSIVVRLQAIGLDESNFSTTFFNSSENYGNKSFWSSKKDFKAVMTACITTEKLELLEAIVVILSEINIERIASISFELREYENLKQDALSKAIAKAKSKAELMSDGLGFEIGGVLRVEEIKTGGDIPLLHIRGGRSGPYNAMVNLTDVDYLLDNSTTIFAQEMTLDAEVKVVFEIDNSTGDKLIETEG